MNEDEPRRSQHLLEILAARPEPEWIKRHRDIEYDVRQSVSEDTWASLAHLTGLPLESCRDYLIGTIVDIRDSITHPDSQAHSERYKQFYSQIADLLRFVAVGRSIYGNIAFYSHHMPAGTPQLVDRLAASYADLLSKVDSTQHLQASASEHVQQLPTMLELLESELIKLLNELPSPTPSGRRKFPERKTAAESAVDLWLHLRWDLGLRGEALVPAKKNHGFKFVAQMLEIGFVPRPVASATVNNLTKQAIASCRDHAIEVSDFIESEIEAGRAAFPVGPGFSVGPHEAALRYLESLGIDLEAVEPPPPDQEK